MAEKLIAKNKKAFFDYEILEKYDAGIVLSGAEAKSIRIGRINLKGSFVMIRGNEIFAEKMHISAYQPKNQPSYDPVRQRKLLLKKEEIDRIRGNLEQKGLTVIPLEIFLKSGLIKVRIGLCRGRKKYDKREMLKKKGQQREIDRAIKY